MSHQDELMIEQSWARLYNTVKDFDIALFAGAGLSKGNAMPDWGQLVARLSSHQSIDIVWQLKNAGFSLPTQLSLAQSTFLGDRPGSDRQTQWTELIRESLYRDFRFHLAERGLDFELLRPMLRSQALTNPQVAEYFQTTNPALYEIVQMCAIRKNGMARIIALLTTNLDSLIQFCDRASMVRRECCERSSVLQSLRTRTRFHIITFTGTYSLFQIRKQNGKRPIG